MSLAVPTGWSTVAVPNGQSRGRPEVDTQFRQSTQFCSACSLNSVVILAPPQEIISAAGLAAIRDSGNGPVPADLKAILEALSEWPFDGCNPRCVLLVAEVIGDEFAYTLNDRLYVQFFLFGTRYPVVRISSPRCTPFVAYINHLAHYIAGNTVQLRRITNERRPSEHTCNWRQAFGQSPNR